MVFETIVVFLHVVELGRTEVLDLADLVEVLMVVVLILTSDTFLKVVPFETDVVSFNFIVGCDLVGV